LLGIKPHQRFFFFQAEDGIRDKLVTGVQTCALPILEIRQVGYVLAVACDHRVTTATGISRADELVARLPKRAWQRLSAGTGAKEIGRASCRERVESAAAAGSR